MTLTDRAKKKQKKYCVKKKGGDRCFYCGARFSDLLKRVCSGKR